MELTQTYVKSLFDYRNGSLYWKVKKAQRVKIGEKAGSIHHHEYGDRWTLKFDKKFTVASRVIFLWHYGWLPTIVDHRDRNKLNDRIENLRAATPSQNSKNKCSQKTSTSKYLGVHFNSKLGVWIGTITTDKKRRHLGCFIKEEDAALAYNRAAIKHHGEFANLNIIT